MLEVTLLVGPLLLVLLPAPLLKCLPDITDVKRAKFASPMAGLALLLSAEDRRRLLSRHTVQLREVVITSQLGASPPGLQVLLHLWVQPSTGTRVSVLPLPQGPEPRALASRAALRSESLFSIRQLSLMVLAIIFI